MKSFDEILEYLNKHNGSVDYQIYPDQADESILVQFSDEIFLFIDVKYYRITLLDETHSPSVKRMEQTSQHSQQAIELAESLKKFLQSSWKLIS